MPSRDRAGGDLSVCFAGRAAGGRFLRAASRGEAIQSTVELPPSLGAQQVLTDPGQKSVRMVRTDTPPVIDGDLGDAVWERAAFIDDLHQTNPIEYAEPSEHTEIYILYDDDALYVAARLHDSGRELITANNMRQNDEIAQDDRFYVVIDPFIAVSHTPKRARVKWPDQVLLTRNKVRPSVNSMVFIIAPKG